MWGTRVPNRGARRAYPAGMRTRSTLLPWALLAAALAAVLTGCSSSPEEPEPTRESAEQLLGDAKSQLDEAASVHLSVASSEVPSSASGLIGGEGVGTHAPAFQGTFQAKLSGAQANVEVVSLGGTVWAKLPFTPAFVEVEPDTFGIPDPASLLSTESGLTSLLPATQNPSIGPDKREGSDVLTTIDGTLPGAKISGLLGVGDPNGSFQVDYGLVAESNQLRTVDLTGPFFDGATSTYSLTLDRYGEPVDIQAP